MKNETIICISPEVWTGMWRERQQIMSRLARDNRVIFVEPGRNEHKSYMDSLMDNVRNLPELGARHETENLVIYSGPPSLPLAARVLPADLMRITSPIVTSINSWSMQVHIKRIMWREGIRDPILWFFGPSCVELAGNLGEKLLCYYVYDEIAEFERNARYKKFLVRRDQTITKKADVVFASSRAQYERRNLLNPNTYFTPHGVDFDFYNSVLDSDTPVADDVARIRKPVIGYIGCLSENLDARILLGIAEKRPDWNLVLIGPDEFPDEEVYVNLKKRPNIHFSGMKDVSVIPHYLKTFDVAILPYRIIGHTKYAYPCKLHEYLASGKPIVAFPLPEILAFKEVIEVASSPREFIDKIENLLAGEDPGNIHKRLDVARQNTWDQRVSIIRKAIDSTLFIKHGNGIYGKRANLKVG